MRAGETGGTREICTDVKERCKQDRGREKETMIGKEEKRQEEVSLIYTLKSPQIFDGSTQLSIEGKEAIYSIFYFLILSSLWCVSRATAGVLWTVCVLLHVQPI